MLHDLQQAENALQRLQNPNAAAFSNTADIRPAKQAAQARPVPVIEPLPEQRRHTTTVSPTKGAGWESFVGTNLISKAGILITIIGIFIGAKYAIDKELVSPVIRIMLGYMAGVVLLTIAIRLKKKYLHYSSILAGGSLAVLYFITYIAYTFYQMIPQPLAFVLMVVITIGAVAMALWYNQKVIAILGQVGAYAIPILLSDDRGQVAVLFSYLSIINIGLLVLSFRKDWRVVYRTGFYISWLIYAAWFMLDRETNLHTAAALAFLTLHFLIFYATFLAFKIFRREAYDLNEVMVLLLNALLFFFCGSAFISNNVPGPHHLALFAVGNAALHAFVGLLIHRLKLFDESVVQFVIALALLFFTIAIPMELDGNWVTLLWAVEGTLLIMIAVRNKVALYLQLAAPLLVITCFSLLHDWWLNYPHLSMSSLISRSPFANATFFTTLIALALPAVVLFIHRQTISLLVTGFYKVFYSVILPLALLVMLYFGVHHEIYFAWHKIATTSNDSHVHHLFQSRGISLFIYTAVFLSLCILAATRVHAIFFQRLLFVAAAFLNLAMLTEGLFSIGTMREDFLDHGHDLQRVFVFRYAFLLSLALLWLVVWFAVKRIASESKSHVLLSLSFNATLLTIISNEFIHWMDIAGYNNQYKLGLTIICGLYALAMLVAGILRKKKHLRVAAIVLFGATIVKLFAYDLASLPTVSKAVVMLVLGALLLIASFLYNNYKEFLFPPAKTGEE